MLIKIDGEDRQLTEEKYVIEELDERGRVTAIDIKIIPNTWQPATNYSKAIDVMKVFGIVIAFIAIASLF